MSPGAGALPPPCSRCPSSLGARGTGGGQSPIPQAGPWEKGPPAVWDSSKPLKCVWGGGQAGSPRAVTELPTPGDLAACVGAELCPFSASCAEMEMLRASGSRASHAPTMAFMSPRLQCPACRQKGSGVQGLLGRGREGGRLFPAGRSCKQHRVSLQLLGADPEVLLLMARSERAMRVRLARAALG